MERKNEMSGEHSPTAQYYYAPHRRLWGIWEVRRTADGIVPGDFVRDCQTREEARREVYRLNNWKYKPLSV